MNECQKMASWIKHLLYKHEDQRSDPQKQLWVSLHTCEVELGFPKQTG